MSLVQRVWNGVRARLVPRLVGAENERLRALYWDLRAADIDQKWGNERLDFEVVASVAGTVGARRILDVGCGSGRLWPLLETLRPELCVGQDVSLRALWLYHRRFPFSSTQLVWASIKQLRFPQRHFDLVISNRVLSAVLPQHIEGTVACLCELSTAVYLNEMTDSDFAGPSQYWFRHDYSPMFEAHGYRVTRQGRLGAQTWRLFQATT